MNNINTIIWDWNGTLLNDIEICIETINTLLEDRNLPLLTIERYKKVFGFPIIDYYKRIGFDLDKEPFEISAHQYIALYTSKLKKSELHQQAVDTLNFFKDKGMKQVILSASETGMLKKSVEQFKITPYFNTLAGLDNHYAQSKVDIGIKMLNNLNIRASEACLLGDTTHDAEVAEKIGCQCILIANGHQSYDTLQNTGNKVIENLQQLRNIF